MPSIFGVSIVLYFIKILSGSRNFMAFNLLFILYNYIFFVELQKLINLVVLLHWHYYNRYYTHS